MKLHVENLTINISSAPPIMAGTLLASITTGLEEPDPTRESMAPSAKPAIGEYWQGQGGIYAGDFRGGDGVVYGLIVSENEDAGKASWGPSGERDLSDWDGLANTRSLASDCPAAKQAANFTTDGHTDFYLPARRELQLAGANLPHLFGKESWYWTSTPYSNDYAWAVDFESGDTYDSYRNDEFRVRPVRRFIY